jgi:hypothetical protein
MREGVWWVIDILETGCWILDKYTHLNTQRPLQETLLRNHKQKIFSSNPLRKLLHSILRGKKNSCIRGLPFLLVIRPTTAKKYRIKNKE